jgi:hypothetical protein
MTVKKGETPAVENLDLTEVAPDEDVVLAEDPAPEVEEGENTDTHGQTPTGTDEAPATETPAEPPAEPPAPEKPAEPDRFAEMERQNAVLTAQVEALTKMLRPAEGQEQPAAPAPAPSTFEGKFEPDLSDEDIEAFVAGDVADVKRILGKVAKQIVDHQFTVAQEIYREVPKIAGDAAWQRQTMQAKVEDFYKANPELAQPAARSLAAQHANAVQAEHPDWDVDQIFAEAAVRSKRTIAELTGPSAPAAPAPPATPPGQQFAPVPGNLRPPMRATLDPLARQLEELTPDTLY